MEYNVEFWDTLDKLVQQSEIVIDRPKGTAHPKYPKFIYKVDYGYYQEYGKNILFFAINYLPN